ncbi:MAG: hypothetical protein WC243_03715 [Patescibacteria group bacterium]|jgi:hypothetical protein
MDRDDHLTHYAVLFLGLALIVGFLIYFRFDRPIQLMVGAFGALFYVAWGVIHHAFEDRLTKEIVMEYLLFGILAFLMLYFALSI